MGRVAAKLRRIAAAAQLATLVHLITSVTAAVGKMLGVVIHITYNRISGFVKLNLGIHNL